MSSHRNSSVRYDLPQDQLDYFGSHTRAFQPVYVSASASATPDKRAPVSSADSPSKQKPPHGSLSDQYQRHFAAQPHEEEETAASSTDRSAAQAHSRDQNQSGRPTPHEPRRADAAAAARRASGPTPLASSPRSVNGEPQIRVLSAMSGAARPQPSAAAKDGPKGAAANAYSQPSADHRHAPVRRSSVSHATPASRDSRTPRSESAASTEDTSASHGPARVYVPRDADAIAPVRPSTAHQQQQQQQPARPVQEAKRQADSLTERRLQDLEQVRDEEENCTFQPKTNPNPSERRSSQVQESPFRGSEGTNAPRDSRGDYGHETFDRLHDDAEHARRAGASRRAQQEVDERELEINARFGPRTTVVNPRRSAVERDVNRQEVFLRLYADAQRYNREKTEQERLLEQKRQEERGDGPFDWNKGRTAKPGAAAETAAGDEDKDASKPRRSPSRQRPIKNNEVFERLARPTSITLSFQKQKEMEENEKHEKEQRELEQKKEEMEKIAAYHWAIPAKSFTFADLESQNAMYAS